MRQIKKKYILQHKQEESVTFLIFLFSLDVKEGAYIFVSVA